MIRALTILFVALSVSVFPAAAAPASSDSQMDKAAARITGSQNYIHISSLNATVTSGISFDGVMTVDAGLELKNAKAIKRANALMPRLRDAMRGAVAAYTSVTYEAGTVPNLDILSMRLQRSVDRVLGEGVATVTLSTVIVRDN